MKRIENIRFIQASVAQSQTDSVLWPAEPGCLLRVLQLRALTPTTATAVTLNSKPAGASGVAITPAFTALAGEPSIEWQASEYGWCTTLPNESLTVTTGAGGTTSFVGVVSVDQALDGVYDERLQPILLENGQPLVSEAG